MEYFVVRVYRRPGPGRKPSTRPRVEGLVEDADGQRTPFHNAAELWAALTTAGGRRRRITKRVSAKQQGG